MQRINKYNDDLLIGIELECSNSCFNIEAFKSINFKVYTLDSNNYIEQYYDTTVDPNFKNIIQQSDQYFLKFEQTDLEALENGQLRCYLEYQLIDTNFSDGTYDASDFIMIDAILGDGTEKINIINKGGCC